ncbi:SDR family NAD(P)-dependent oxidoreductase [Haloarcula litorea]|uniref:SDR family NAD(P)-dependent oxidoreductase n=1 Tax=Haloarcula litorea TaxID=3032579 RepID=UPI0023E8B1DE|nr:SDR family NAD(P)-dependent oxidoreductase [Halomicroarcula sp. GDY20]
MGDDPPVHDSLDGQVALVTGATRGIGARIAAALADRGATVYAGARDTDDVTAPAQRPVELDVTEEAEIAAAVDRIDDEAGRLDVLVNNAGVFHRSGPLHEMSTADLDHTLDVNLRGPVLVTRHALPLLLDTDGPRVVTMSSGLGRFTRGRMGGDYPAYRLSKVGVGGLTAYLDAEYGGRGLLANAADPGWVRTDMGGSGAPRTPEEGADTAVWLSRFRPGAPAGRLWKDRDPVDW